MWVCVGHLSLEWSLNMAYKTLYTENLNLEIFYAHINMWRTACGNCHIRWRDNQGIYKHIERTSSHWICPIHSNWFWILERYGTAYVGIDTSIVKLLWFVNAFDKIDCSIAIFVHIFFLFFFYLSLVVIHIDCFGSEYICRKVTFEWKEITPSACTHDWETQRRTHIHRAER